MSETVTTSRGVTVTCLPIQTLLDKLNSQYKPPEPPSYEVTLMGGAVERHAHDETTLETDEDKAAWAQYKRDLAKVQAEHNAKLTRLVLLRGIAVDMPEGDAWAKEQAYLGIQVPDDPIERKLHYIETEVIAGVRDVEAIMLGVMRASGVPEDLLQQMEDTFRRSLGQREGSAAGRSASAGDGASVVVQPKIRAGTDSGQNGSSGKPIRRTKRRG